MGSLVLRITKPVEDILWSVDKETAVDCGLKERGTPVSFARIDWSLGQNPDVFLGLILAPLGPGPHPCV